MRRVRDSQSTPQIRADASSVNALVGASASQEWEPAATRFHSDHPEQVLASYPASEPTTSVVERMKSAWSLASMSSMTPNPIQNQTRTRTRFRLRMNSTPMVVPSSSSCSTSDLARLAMVHPSGLRPTMTSVSVRQQELQPRQ